MIRRVLLDTSIVLELLEVPFESDPTKGIATEFERRSAAGTQFILPFAAIVEAGDHVGRIVDGHDRRKCAVRLEAMILATIDRTAPWTFVPMAWDGDVLSEIVQPTDPTATRLVESLATKHLEMGDLLILGEFKRIRASLDRTFVDLDLWTLDSQLDAVVAAL